MAGDRSRSSRAVSQLVLLQGALIGRHDKGFAGGSAVTSVGAEVKPTRAVVGQKGQGDEGAPVQRTSIVGSELWKERSAWGVKTPDRDGGWERAIRSPARGSERGSRREKRVEDGGRMKGLERVGSVAIWRRQTVEEGTALTLCCPPRRATPARQGWIGNIGLVCDVEGVKVEESEPVCREEEGCSAPFARGPGAHQHVRACQSRGDGYGVAPPAVPQSHSRPFRRRHSRGGARGAGIRLTETSDTL